MQREDPVAAAVIAATDDQVPAELLARLAEAEALLAEERASNQALSDELLRVRSEKSVSPAAAGGSRRDTSSINSSSSSNVSAVVAAAAAAATEDIEPPPPAAERARRRNRGDDERPRPPWQNVLYKRQPYADNHVPDSFLEKLVTNGECLCERRQTTARWNNQSWPFGARAVRNVSALLVCGAVLCVYGASSGEHVGMCVVNQDAEVLFPGIGALTR